MSSQLNRFHRILNHRRHGLPAAVAVALLLAALTGCDRQPAAPQGDTGTAAAAPGGRGAATPPPVGSQAGAAPAGAGGGTVADQAAAEVPGQPRTNELQPLAQGVTVPNAPPAAAPAAGDLAARERQLADRQAALDAREARLRRREATPPTGRMASNAHGGGGANNPDNLQTSPPPTPPAAEPPPYGEPASADQSGGPGAGNDQPAGADQGIGASAPGAGAAADLGSPGAPGNGAASAAMADDRQRAAVAVPAGTPFEVAFTRGLASNTSSAGDTFRARVLSDVRVDGATVIPAGSEILGVVTEAVATRRIGGKAKLSVKFTDLVLPSGSTVPVHASFLEEGKSKTGRDAATIGGSAAGGALLGRILGQNGRGTILGALVGAAVGTAIASKTAGDEVVIPEGSVVKLKLDETLDLRDRR
jgi:hypothetical protein